MIGIFDSGFGGLTILRAIEHALPRTDLVYLGDNAHAPYGDREPDEIFTLTLSGVRTLVSLGCPLIVVACNTASAQALRRIQQDHLPVEFPDRRVLGVIRPSAEVIAVCTHTGHIGVIATRATAAARAYTRECSKMNSTLVVTEVPCPEIVPLVEAGTLEGRVIEEPAARAVLALLTTDPAVDTVLLGSTHFPLVAHAFRRALPPDVELIAQGPIIAEKLVAYLTRHPEINARISATGLRRFLTTGDPDSTSRVASALLRRPLVFERAPGIPLA